MALKLSVLIATMPSRQSQFDSLIAELNRQNTQENIEIISDDSMEYNIGVKRNKLLNHATGEYVVFIDDDDTISPIYIQLILSAIETEPDCIGISGTMTTNGQNQQQWHISKDNRGWYSLQNIYYRTPNHISPVRRELALQAGFPEIEHGEDYGYSMRLLPMLKTEVKIRENIYHYHYASK